MSRREERAARRAAISGAGPTSEVHVDRFPGARGGFALFGEVLMTGMLVALVGLPLVTLPAALASGIRHIRRYLHAEDSRLVFFWHDVRAALPAGSVVGTVILAVTLVLLLDIELAGSGALPGGEIVLTIGWIGLGTVGVTLLAAATAWAPSTGWLRAIRSIPAGLARDMPGALYLLSTVVFVVVVTWALPPLIIAGLGCAALAAVAIPERLPRRR